MKKLIYLSSLAVLSLFTACDKNDDSTNSNSTPAPTPTTSGTVTVDISNVADQVNVDETGATNYTNSSNETFNVTMLRYYLSNFELLTDTGAYKVPQSYFLVDEAVQSSTTLAFNNVPAGYYKGIRFMVGVDDSIFNYYTANSIIPTGALDPANGMMWTWNSGYIHFKMEGTYNNSSSNYYFYHIGGMNGQYAGQRMVQLTFNGDSLHVNGTQEADLHLLADVLKLFSGNSDVSLVSTHNVMNPDANSVIIADNYATMFTFDHMHN